jgi:hypothetical protein
MTETLIQEGPIVVSYDESPDNPRDLFVRTILHLDHSRYDLAQETGLGSPRDYDEGTAGFEAALREDYPEFRLVPVYGYEHGGLSLSLTPFSDPWDSGQAGIILIHKDDADAAAQAELEEYTAYLNGHLYRWTLDDDENDLYEGAGGYLSIEDALEDAKAMYAELLAEVAV